MDWVSIIYWSGFCVNIIILILTFFKTKESIPLGNTLLLLFLSWLTWVIALLVTLEDDDSEFVVIMLPTIFILLIALLKG